MVADDLTSLSAIAMGALASTALTVSLVARAPATALVQPEVTVEACVTEDRAVVDFAIIRGPETALTVGPEHPVTGRVRARSLELRFAPTYERERRPARRD